MPSRFEVVPDVAADAALSLSDALQSSQAWLDVMHVSVHGMVRGAGARVTDAVKALASNLTNNAVDTTEMLQNASNWFSTD